MMTRLAVAAFVAFVISGCCNCPRRGGGLPPRVKEPTRKAEEKMGGEMMDRYLRGIIRERKKWKRA